MTGDRTVLPPRYHTDWHPITYHTTVTCDCTYFYFEIFIEIHKIDSPLSLVVAHILFKIFIEIHKIDSPLSLVVAHILFKIFIEIHKIDSPLSLVIVRIFILKFLLKFIK